MYVDQWATHFGSTMASLQLYPAFGLVILDIVFSFIVHYVWMALKIAKARKAYKVGYPLLYAPPENKDANVFNCIQRGHQNSLENFAAHLILTLLVAIKYPFYAFVTGVLYDVGRIIYFTGYSSGVPKNRLRGGFMHIGTVGQLLGCILIAVQCLVGKA